jgi:hypothetical protein
MAAREMLERFSNEVMSEALTASEDSRGEVLVGVGDAFIWFS